MTYSLPDRLARGRRAMRTWRDLAAENDVKVNTAIRAMTAAGYDTWGYRAGITRRCDHCEKEYEPTAVRKQVDRFGSPFKWPAQFCSWSCHRLAEKARLARNQRKTAQRKRREATNG